MYVKVPSELRTTVPLAGSETGVVLTVSVSPSVSLSLPRTLSVSEASSVVTNVSSAATGPSLTEPTVILTVA